MGNGPAAHRISATGHAHLDTAWLWPIRETRRKVVRTFANALSLLKTNPDYVFCHSQAQHYAWVAEDAPEVFEEVKRFVALGRWEIVGGMWVETDLNLPSGESLLRQLVQGQRSFQEWFNTTCRGAFLPDDFGYPAGLPQIVAHAGCEWFFTQKLSWNETNKMPHHSFWWEGLDGTKVFAHFSPIDTYNALLLPSQLRFAEHNYRDHAGSSHSLVLYGHGDGGGGPTQTRIERGRLAHDLDQVPRVTFDKVDHFFTQLMDEYQDRAPVWNGEMYFEKHRGTYSTQLGTKQGNRWSERLLHELELWSAAVGFRPTTIDELWQRVLTQQFHDIIPGSSIAWVHQLSVWLLQASLQFVPQVSVHLPNFS
jgi:alpha-mannosidase